MGMKLFDDVDAADNVDISKIEIDQEFARRYEHNKKREALQRYEELKKKGEIDDSSLGSESGSQLSDEDEDEDEDDIINANEKKDIKFFENLLKVKNRDPSLYQNIHFFSDSEGDVDEEDMDNNKDNENKKKAMYLKDVVAQHLIEEGPEFEDTETSKGKRKTYYEEQEELKKQFFDAVKTAEEGEDEDGEGDFLKVKDKSNDNRQNEEDDKEFEMKLGEYFGQEGGLDENSMFLKEFFMNKMWIDKGNKKGKSVFDNQDMEDLLRDEEEIERQEEYEESYNFRHEENAGDRVMGHSRKVEGSVRKKENARKEQRKSKEERMKIAELERKEELKHLKNLKKREMEEKIQRVMDAAGIKNDDCPLDLDDLVEDFDPQEYDKMMKKAFDDTYYEAEDADPEFGSDDDFDEHYGSVQKPDFDNEDELLGLPKGWDIPDNGDSFLAARERDLKQQAETVDMTMMMTKKKRRERKVSGRESVKCDLCGRLNRNYWRSTINWTMRGQLET